MNKKIYRYDIVGSFLRSDRLKKARNNFNNGSIDEEALIKIEDEEIQKLVEKEEDIGLKAVSDGEYRRSYWHLDFLASLLGIEQIKTDNWSVDFKGSQPKGATLKIIDKIDFQNNQFIDHFKYLQSIISEGAEAKMTIPSPTMLHLICCIRNKDYEAINTYDNEKKLYDDIALTYQKIIKAFYEAGCRYLQLDDTSWGEFCSKEKQKEYSKRGIDIGDLSKKYVDLINLSIVNKPDDMLISMHICRGNFRSTWFSSGGYEPIAKELFSNCKVDEFFLEYDSDRSGDFKPLRYIKDQIVVLGLVTSKFPELESKEVIKARINEASRFVNLDQLCLSTQCGFASTEEGNNLTEKQQWAKLILVKEIAKEVWG